MKNHDWILIKTITEERNMTRAAERLNVSQPAITYRVKLLEKEFGANLLIRTPNGVSLIPRVNFCSNTWKKYYLG